MEAIKTRAYGATNSIFNGLAPMEIERHPPQADEVHLDILYCGVCHSDLHQVKNDWGNTIYPCVPGHEVAGRRQRRYQIQDRRHCWCRLHD